MRKCGTFDSLVAIVRPFGRRENTFIFLEHILNIHPHIYYETRNCHPIEIDIISGNFKRKRYNAILKSINEWHKFQETWEVLNFFPVGDLFGDSLKNVIIDEKAYIHLIEKGIEFYYTRFGLIFQFNNLLKY